MSKYLSDDEVFGGSQPGATYLSDDEVFGDPAPREWGGRTTMPTGQDPRRFESRADLIAEMDEGTDSTNPNYLQSTTNKPGTVLEQVLQDQPAAVGRGRDAMLNPEFIQSFRQELGSLPIEKRLGALKAYADTDQSVYGRAARAILYDEEAKNKKVTIEGKREGMRLLGGEPSPMKFGKGTGRAATFPDATPNFVERYDGITDKQVAGANDIAMGASGVRENIKNEARVATDKLQRKADEGRSASQWASDTWTAVNQGTISLAQLPLNIVSPSSLLAESLRETQKELSAQESDVLQAKRQLMADRIKNESGFLDQYLTTIYSLVSDPALAIQEGVKQIPNFIGVLGAAKLVAAGAGGIVVGAGRLAPATVGLGEAISGGAINAAARSFGATAGGIGASMVMAGGDAAGNTYERLIDPKQTNLSVWEKNPDYQKLIASNVSSQDAIKEIATAKARMAALITAPLGVFGFMGAEASMVNSGIRRAIGQSARPQGAAKIVGKELAGEQAEEGLTQAGSNFATRTIDPAQSLMEGVPQAMGTAAVVSGPFAGMAIATEKLGGSSATGFNLASLNPNLTATPIAPRVQDQPTTPTVPNITRADVPVAPPVAPTAPIAPGSSPADRIAAILNLESIQGTPDAPASIQNAPEGQAVDGLPAGPAAAGGAVNLDAGAGVPAGAGQAGFGLPLAAWQSGGELAGVPAPLAGQPGAVAPGAVAPGPVAPGPAAKAEAVQLLDSATKLHKGHMDGSVATTEKSQQQLMGMIAKASDALTNSPSQQPGAEAAPDFTKDLADARASLAGLELRRKLIRGSKRADMDAQIERVKDTIYKIETATDTTPAADIRLGRNNEPIHRGGKPYTTNKDAKKAKALQPIMRVVRVDGGYALAEKTPAQLAAEEANSRRLRNPNTSPADQAIPAHAMIAAAGMLHPSTRADMGMEGNVRIGNRMLFASAGNGLTMEQATEKLIEDGYLQEGASHDDARNLIKRSLNEPQYTPEGVERMAEKEAVEREAAYHAEQEAIALAQEAEDNAYDALVAAYQVAKLEIPPTGQLDGMSLDEALWAVGYTEEEISDDRNSTAEIQTPSRSTDAGAAGSFAQGAQSPAEAAAGARPQSIGGRDRTPSSVQGQDQGLSAPTQQEVLDQQDRKDNAVALDQREQIDKEVSGQTLTSQATPEQRKDTSGDMFGEDKAELEAAKRKADAVAKNEANKDPNQGAMFDDPVPPAREPDQQERRAKADLQNALADLGDIFSAKFKANMMTPEQEAKLVPVLARVLDAAFRLGYVKFKDAAKFALDQIRAAFGAEVADSLTIDQLQGSYIAMAGGRPGADTKRAVIDVEDKADIENHTAKADNPIQEQRNVPSPDAGVERNSQGSGVEPAVGDAVSDDARGTAARTGAAGGQASRGDGRGQRDGAGVSAGGAAADGERSDQLVRGGGQPAGPQSSDARTDFGERSGDSGITGIPPDAIATKEVDAAATSGDADIRKRSQQSAASKLEVKAGDLQNVRDTLPYLLPGQQEDVHKAETVFAKPTGYGMLFTNGTGTGKTFSGLGVVKRFAMQGKTNTLIVVPDNKIASDWVKSGRALGLQINQLKSTTQAGSGIVLATYANLGANDVLASRQWDLIVPDESHSLMQSADGVATNYLQNLRAITHHPDGAMQRYTMQNRNDIDRFMELDREIVANSKLINKDDTMDVMRQSLQAANKKLENEQAPLRAKLQKARDAVNAEIQSMQGEKRTRLVFLSATPFAYEKTVDWANGYLFDYMDGYPYDLKMAGLNYNQPDPFQYFMMTRFGYTMRMNKLNQPGAKVDSGLMQRQFNGELKKKGVLSGRMLEVKPDYDRRFVLIDSAIGNKIDEALEWLNEAASEQREQQEKVEDRAKRENGMARLRDAIADQFDYLSRRYLLEAIKAEAVIPIVKQHMALGRKVVVFHDYNKGGSSNPFFVPKATASTDNTNEGRAKADGFNRALAQFNAQFPELVTGLNDLLSPIEIFKKELPQTMLINGKEKERDLLARYLSFQDDANGPQVMLVQSDKNKGWSGHDTTGKHQRVLINLGQPTAPTKAIQQEGRIYRTGQASDAIMRYLNTGTSWERWAFATTIASRSSTAENLGMGEQARALKDSFIAAFEESDTFAPGHEGEGIGGKARDKASNKAITEYDRAKTFYWATGKKNSKTKAQEGADYFATPEPVGLKMVEWLDAQSGDALLEPSGGHGAIARWMPEKTQKTVVEPSANLRSRMALVLDMESTKMVGGIFEDLNVINKFDGVAMNPPFGSGGKTAIDHLAKAATHLRAGGRIVALIPTGPAADKKFEKWFYETSDKPAKPLGGTGKHGPIYRGDTVTIESFGASYDIVAEYIDGPASGAQYIRAKGTSKDGGINTIAISKVAPTGQRTESYRATADLQLVADIKLPSVTFERAGTAVNTRIVVLEKVSNSAMDTRGVYNRDYSDITDINELFDALENVVLPTRADPQAPEAPAAPAKPAPIAKAPAAAAAPGAGNSDIITVTTSKGKELRGVIRADLSKEQAKAIDPYTWIPTDKDGKRMAGYFIREKHLTDSNDGAPVFVSEPTVDYNGNYETDLFGNPLPQAQRKSRPARPVEAGLRGNAQPAGALQDTPAPRGEFYVNTFIGTEANREIGAAKIITPVQAAQATQYLYKSAVERFDGIVTDKNGKPLAVIGGFKGAVTQASVYPATLMGEAVRIPGAARVWFSHNHPSGTAILSKADIALNNTLAQVFRGSGIEPMGLLAVAGDQFTYVDENGNGSETTNRPIPPSSTKITIPVIERQNGGGKPAQIIASPSEAKEAAKAFYSKAKEPGILLLTSQNSVAGWMPISAQMMGPLRNTGGLNAIYRAASQSNASAAILVHGGELLETGNLPMALSAGENIAAALAKVDVMPLDSINAVSGQSRAEMGLAIARGPMFSQGLFGPSFGPKPTLDEVNRLVAKVQAVSKNVIPITVVRNPSQIIGVEFDVPAGVKPLGALINGQIYLFTDNLRSTGDVSVTIFHELFHLGLSKVISAEDYAALLREFAKEPIAQSYINEWKTSPEGRQRAATMPSAAYEALANEEGLAIISEALFSDRGAGTKNLPSLIREMMMWLAKVADRVGLPGNFSEWVRGLTQTDAERFVSQMVRAAMGGPNNLAKTRRKFNSKLENLSYQTRLSSGGNQTGGPASTTAATQTGTAAAPTKAARSLWFDETGRLQFAPGAAVNQWLSDGIVGKALSRAMLRTASPAMRKQLRAMKLAVQAAQDKAVEVAKVAQTMSPDELVMVSDVIEQELAAGTVPPAEVLRMASVMDAAMAQQTLELVDLGMLTAETAARWDGKYLPRYYGKNLGKTVEAAWEKAVRMLTRKPSALTGMKGKHLKGRGLYATAFANEVQDWLDLGYEIRDADLDPAVKTEADVKSLIRSRQIKARGEIQVWRDYTRDEREDMGEIRDASLRFTLGYMETQRDIALGRMFEAMAADPELSSKTATDKHTHRVPDGTLEGSGAKRYGKLSGRFISRDDFSQLDNATGIEGEVFKAYKDAQAVWKEGKTAAHPLAHFNNIVSNMTMAHFAGVSYWDTHKYIGALFDFATSAPKVQEARDAGLFLGTVSDEELRNMLPEELRKLVVQTESYGRKIGRTAINVMMLGLRKPLNAAYKAEDLFYRYLIWKDATSRGLDPEDAVDYAQKFIFTYDDLPKTARWIRDFNIPFFGYTFKFIPAFVSTALTHPIRLAAPAAVSWALYAMAYGLLTSGDDEDEGVLKAIWESVTDPVRREKAIELAKEEGKNLPEWMKGSTSLGTPRAIRLKNDEATGLPMFIDVSRIVPGGDIFDVHANAGGVPVVQWLTPNNPLLTTFGAMFLNRDSFTGRDIVDKEIDTDMEAAKKRGAWLWKQWTPAITAGNYHWERTMQAAATANGGELPAWVPDLLGGDSTGVGKDGVAVTPGRAALNTIGIKIRPIDLDRSEVINESQKERLMREIDARVRSLQRQHRAGAISDRTLDKERDIAIEKKDRLRDNLTVDGNEKK